MTFSTPLFKIIVACFAVAALVATAMTGSESAGLKGSRKLQPSPVNSIFASSNAIFANLNPPPPVTPLNSIFANSKGIFANLNPTPPVIPVNSIITNSNGIIATINPPPVPVVNPLGPATIATNSVLFNAAQIFKTLNP